MTPEEQREFDGLYLECYQLRDELTRIKTLLGMTGPTDIGDVYDGVFALACQLHEATKGKQS